MIDSPQTRVGMSLADFLREQADAPFELIDGEKLPKMPTAFMHSLVLKKLFLLLVAYEQAHKTIVTLYETTFAQTESPDWVKGSRIPDLMVYQAETIAAFMSSEDALQNRPINVVPDLCVEVVSPTDRFSEVERKVSRYFEDGVQAVWVIDPEEKLVFAYQAGSNQVQRLTSDDELIEPNLLPEFTVRVGDLFPA